VAQAAGVFGPVEPVGELDGADAIGGRSGVDQCGAILMGFGSPAPLAEGFRRSGRPHQRGKGNKEDGRSNETKSHDTAPSRSSTGAPLSMWGSTFVNDIEIQDIMY